MLSRAPSPSASSGHSEQGACGAASEESSSWQLPETPPQAAAWTVPRFRQLQLPWRPDLSRLQAWPPCHGTQSHTHMPEAGSERPRLGQGPQFPAGKAPGAPREGEKLPREEGQQHAQHRGTPPQPASVPAPRPCRRCQCQAASPTLVAPEPAGTTLPGNDRSTWGHGCRAPSPAPAPNTSCASTAGPAGSLWPDTTALLHPGPAQNLGPSLGQEGEQGQRNSPGLGTPAHTARCERVQHRRPTLPAPLSRTLPVAPGTRRQPGPPGPAGGPTLAAEPRGCEGGRAGLAPRGGGTGPGPLLPSAPAGPAASPARSRRPGAAAHGLCSRARPPRARGCPTAAAPPAAPARGPFRLGHPSCQTAGADGSSPPGRVPCPLPRGLPAPVPPAAGPVWRRRRVTPRGARSARPGAGPGPGRGGRGGPAGPLVYAEQLSAPPRPPPARTDTPAPRGPPRLRSAAQPGPARRGTAAAPPGAAGCRHRRPPRPPPPNRRRQRPAPGFPGHPRAPREPGPLSPGPAWGDPPAAGTGQGRGSAQPLPGTHRRCACGRSGAAGSARESLDPLGRQHRRGCRGAHREGHPRTPRLASPHTRHSGQLVDLQWGWRDTTAATGPAPALPERGSLAQLAAALASRDIRTVAAAAWASAQQPDKLSGKKQHKENPPSFRFQDRDFHRGEKVRSELWFITALVIRNKQYAFVSHMHRIMSRATPKPGQEQKAKAAEPKLT